MKKYFIITIVLWSLGTLSYGQEICNNGIDDDGNSLIDAEDPACSACYEIIYNVESEDFENYSCCPSFWGEINCLEGGWEVMSGTPDYFNTCDFLGVSTGYEVPLPMPSGEGAIGIVISEAIGKCMIGNLIPGNVYDISFYVGFNDVGDYASNLAANISIFGTDDCDNISFSQLCIDPNWSEIASFTITSTVQDNWVFYSGTFSPSVIVNTIAIGHTDCNEVTGHFFDDITISGDFMMLLDDVPTITQSGNCIDGVYLESDVIGTSYQWYINGVAIANSDVNPYQLGSQSANYEVAVNDLCNLISDPLLVIIDTEVLNVEDVVTDVSCFSESDGSIVLTTDSPNLPIDINWSNGAEDLTIDGLGVGVYNVTVTDGNGCFSITSYQIVGPTEIVVDIEIMQPVNGNTTGEATLNISGGTPGYEINWSDGETGVVNDMIEPGVYTVLVTDANGCETELEFEIFEELLVTYFYEAGNCNSFCGGFIEIIDIIGGQVDYNITWSNGETTMSIDELCDGSYSFIVTDNFGTNFSEEIILEGGGMGLVWSSTYDNLLCDESQSTNISIDVSGGSLPYSYLWSTGETVPYIENIEAGSYAVTVIDNEGCNLEQSYQINIAPLLALTENITLVSCGNANGSIALTINTAEMPLTYLWSNEATTMGINNLTSGNYTLTITDGNGCEWEYSYAVSSESDLEISYVAEEESCEGMENGSISLEINGGTEPYTILWDTGDNSDILTGLSAGNYEVIVTDMLGCQWSDVIVINTLIGVAVTDLIVDVSCFGTSNGEIILEVSGDSTAYTYEWSNGSSDQNQNNLSSGTYELLITDSIGCQFSYEYIVGTSSQLIISDSIINVSCYGSSDGSIALNIIGGMSPYEVMWSNGETGLLIENQSAGSYVVTIVDALLCVQELSYVVNEPQELVIAIDYLNNPSSSGNDGSIGITITGGNAPYEILWNTGWTTAELIDVGFGDYTAMVTDDNGCTTTIEVTLSASTMSFTSDKLDNACYGECLGAISLSIMEGVMPYEVIWSNGEIGTELTNLCNGSYTATITDAQGQELITTTYEINSPTMINIDGTVYDISCIDLEDGEIEVTASGGSMPFQYAWDNSAVGKDLSDLSVGTYEVTVIDENDCINTSEFTISDIALADLWIEVDGFDCGENITSLIIKGDNAYNYPILINGEEQILNEENKIENLTSGMYNISYQINEGCDVLIEEVEVLNPNDYEIALNLNSAIVKKGTLLELTLDIISEFQLTYYSIEWQVLNGYECIEFVEGDQCSSIAISVDEAEELVLIFTDDRGCVRSLSATINVEDNVEVYIPNIFSPNGDGNQDELIISTNSIELRVNRFIIFDRWGNVMYSEEDKLLSELVPWDGLVDDKEVSVGVYVFLFEMIRPDGERIVRVGDITLIR